MVMTRAMVERIPTSALILSERQKDKKKLWMEFIKKNHQGGWSTHHPPLNPPPSIKSTIQSMCLLINESVILIHRNIRWQKITIIIFDLFPRRVFKAYISVSVTIKILISFQDIKLPESYDNSKKQY